MGEGGDDQDGQKQAGQPEAAQGGVRASWRRCSHLRVMACFSWADSRARALSRMESSSGQSSRTAMRRADSWPMFPDRRRLESPSVSIRYEATP